MGYKVWIFIFSGLSGLGGVACILQWLHIEPKDMWGLHMSLAIPQWFWLLAAIALFVISFILSSVIAVRSSREAAKLRGDLTNALAAQTAAENKIAQLEAEIKRKSSVAPNPKLKITKAVYGAGPNADIDITESLKNKERDGLVIPVDNNLVPYDPAFGVRKRLVVEYSYGDGIVYCASRRESMQGDIVRLTLPEDSELHRLTDELKKKPEQTEKGKAAVELDKPNAAPIRNWNAEWKELASKFEKAGLDVSAQWQCNRRNNQTIFENWNFSGTYQKPCETLCRFAGTLLAKSPNVSRALSQLALQSDPAWRWLFFLKDNHNALDLGSSLPPIGDDGTIYLHGRISNVAAVSARVCMECAALEL